MRWHVHISRVRYPFTPFPDGWFFVCHASALAGDRMFSRTFLGEEIIAHRDRDGVARVFDAHCPHLGAHLGHTGSVEQGEIKCRFHGLAFDGGGRCVRTSRGSPSRPIALRAWQTIERNGFVFAHHSKSSCAPTWSIPELPLDGFGEVSRSTLRVRSHPQEMAENTVDMTHFGEVHGFRDIHAVEPLHWSGPHLTCAYRVRVESPLLNVFGLTLRVDFRLHKWGLGYSLAEIDWPQLGLSARQYVFPTPLDGEWVELNLAMCMRTRAASSELAARPARLVTTLARNLFMWQFQREVKKDIVFWETKRYLSHPALDASDGPIGEFRRYCRQFYPRLPQVAHASASSPY
jgi:phenylpropionate dioxygenase-like ring-hydroxylating dioxygenase large terminal subunit